VVEDRPVAGQRMFGHEGVLNWFLTLALILDAVATKDDGLCSWGQQPPVTTNADMIGPAQPLNYDVQQWSMVPYKDEVSKWHRGRKIEPW
jgi:hypothetical protein